jgi:hypothetical protein
MDADTTSPSLRRLLEEICTLLRRRESGDASFSADQLQDVMPLLRSRLTQLVGDRATPQGRTGMGTYSDVPWMGLFPPGQKTSAQQGYYLVYLFAKDGSAVYLSLNQGTEIVKGGTPVLRKRAIDIRRAVGPQPDLLTRIELHSTNTRPRKYEAGSAYALAYPDRAIPDDDRLVADLHRMLGIRDEVSATGLRWDLVNEPIHLVFKWNADREAATIDRHREVASREGSVWWGRFSRSPTPSMSKRRLDQLQTQIAAGEPTHAYLYRRGSLWRTDILEATVLPPDPVDRRFPAYYQPSDCNFFVRLSNFTVLSPDWLHHNAVLADHPDANPERLIGGLGNQTNPLYVFELWGSSTSALDPGQAPPSDDDVDEDDEFRGRDDITLRDVCDELARRMEDAGLTYGARHLELVRAAVTSLATKQLLFVSGLTGSGKTRLATAIGDWFGHDRIEVVRVRPDWTSPEAVLGFENGLTEPVGGRYVWMMTRAMQLIWQAANDPRHPYALLLEEMNLAHVERYFADVLSGLESGRPCLPNLHRQEGQWRLAEPTEMALPANLFIIGTVNVDDTTYMFSPKTLDRGNVMEFRVLTEDLVSDAGAPGDVEAGSPTLVRRFLTAATTTTADPDWGDRSQLEQWWRSLHRLLSGFDLEFGRRTFLEVVRFGELLAEAGEPEPLVALDLQVLQRMLPGLRGSIREIAEPLRDIASWCWHGPDGPAPAPEFDALAMPAEAAKLPRSFTKLKKMTRRLHANHFVSFFE